MPQRRGRVLHLVEGPTIALAVGLADEEPRLAKQFDGGVVVRVLRSQLDEEPYCRSLALIESDAQAPVGVRYLHVPGRQRRSWVAPLFEMVERPHLQAGQVGDPVPMRCLGQ